MNKPFDIRVNTLIFFRDCTGEIIKTYFPGDIIRATAEADHYYVTPMGGIFKGEAERVIKEEPRA